jgi:mRNA interferase MazF
MSIKPGDIYWFQPDSSDGMASDIAHPHVVVEVNALNDGSTMHVVLCAVTSNRKRVTMPGNILLDSGEGNLTRRSVVEVSKTRVLDKGELGDYIGSLSASRVEQILAGRLFVTRSFLGVSPDQETPKTPFEED